MNWVLMTWCCEHVVVVPGWGHWLRARLPSWANACAGIIVRSARPCCMHKQVTRLKAPHSPNATCSTAPSWQPGTHRC